MGDLYYFQPKSQISADQNLREFIRQCRDELTVFGADLNWRDLTWPGAANFTKLGVNSRAATENDRLDDTFVDFAKAYFRYQQGHNPTEAKNELKALRVLEAALIQINGTAAIGNIDVVVLDEAAMIARSHYSKMAAYHCGGQLERLAKFVCQKQLVSTNIDTWVSQIKKPSDDRIRTGEKAKAVREKKMPSSEAIDALAEIFANVPEDPRDIFTSCLFAMSMCAPSRCTELLELPVDCEVEEQDSKGVLRYGWRFYSGKGYGGDIKWIPTEMVQIAKTAVRRIRELTNEARNLAIWIEENPATFYRHPKCPGVGEDVPLTHNQVSQALGLKLRSLSNAGLTKNKTGVQTLRSLWQYVMAHQPKGFPWVSNKKKVKYGNALFCMTKDFLSKRKNTSPVVLWAPDINVFNNDLSPRESLKVPHENIFDRHGFQASNGKRLKLTSHQARHLLGTIAQRGGLSQDEIAKWSGRADIKQNHTYNHMSEYEMVAAAEALNTSLILHGLDGEVAFHLPISTQEFNLLETRGAVHVTEFGVCVHNYILSPCEKFRDCLNCGEQVCIKGDVEKHARITKRLQQVEENYAAAKQAMENCDAGADRWFEYHTKTLERLRQLVAILQNPDIPDGSQIKLRDGKDFSHLRRSMKIKAANAIEQESPDAPLLSEMTCLLGGGLG